MVVGEQPGDQEDRRGEPFVGPAGKALYGPSFRVGESRGRRQDWPSDVGGATSAHVPDWVVTTTHPSAVLRSREQESDYDLLVADLRVVAEALATG
jgi:uracil-DNA glycosylase